jgi:hypothetical protein
MEKLKLVKTAFFEFCSTSSIHGLTQIADSSKPLAFRLIWFFVFITSIVYAIFIIANTVDGKQIQYD